MAADSDKHDALLDAYVQRLLAVEGDGQHVLSDSDLPVKEIAARLGFTSAAYFSRAFQNETGQSPTEFRRLA